MAEPIMTAQEALNLVADYYKTTVPEITRILNQYGADTTSVKDILAILIDDGATAYDLIYNADGSIRNIVYNNVTDYLNSGASSALNAMHQINSNAAATAVAEKVKLSAPVQAALKAAGTGATFTVGATAAKTGALATVVTNPIGAGVAGVAAAVALGVGIDAALYKLNPHFWTDLGFTDVDPAEYAKIVDPAGLFTGLFKTDAAEGTSQMYLDENALAYIAKYLNGLGTFDITTTQELTSGDYNSSWVDPSLYTLPIPTGQTMTTTDLDAGSLHLKIIETWAIDDGYLVLTGPNDTAEIQDLTVVTNKETAHATRHTIQYYPDGTIRKDETQDVSLRKYDYHGQIYYGSYAGGRFLVQNPTLPLAPSPSLSDVWALGYLLYNGNVTTETTGGVSGITKQNGGTTPNLGTDDTVAEVLAKLKDQYPGLWDNALTINTPQPDGTFKTYTYVPVGSAVANSRLDQQPTNTTQTQTDTAVNVNTSPQDLVDTIIQTTTSKPTKTDVNTGTNTGNGGTPVVPPVTGKASALYSIYNPTLAQVNSLGAWLWSSNFIDQLLKLFSSPMDAIIGLHKIYATPATGADQNIKVGYLDSGVPSKIVTEQYTTVDCGTVNCYEYFGNVLDYNPYTNIRLYLPFIGIIDLSNSDVMRSNVNVVYHVDVLSGACLAEVKITRDGGGGTLYQYAGNAATTLPISSGSYMGVVSSVSSVATRALAGFASGGALGAVASGATGILNAQGTNVVHSGGFSGNAGAMGCKKPYLIIERPQTETADNTANLLGYGSNLFTKLKACKGFTRVKGVHVDAVPATKEEKKLIEEKLMNGVIIG